MNVTFLAKFARKVTFMTPGPHFPRCAERPSEFSHSTPNAAAVKEKPHVRGLRDKLTRTVLSGLERDQSLTHG